MDGPTFWDIIDTTRPANGDKRRHLAALRKHLRALAPGEIADFQRHLDAAMADAQRYDLWDAAALIKGWCTDDGFIYFCLWLIAQGQAAYRAALDSPDTLAGVVKKGGMTACSFELLWGVAREAYEKVAGHEMPASGVAWPSRPAGRRGNLQDEGETRRRFPDLTNRFGT
jgi:hypothetical protein